MAVRQTIRLHPAQTEFVASKALYRGFVGGRGSGKTRAGAVDLLLRSKPGRTYLVGSPTGIMLADTTLPMFRAVATEMGLWGDIKLTPYPNLTLSTGAHVRFRTADNPDRMRGPNISGAWLDEASLMHLDAYTICIASLREAGEQGWLSATFTPRGPSHWTYETFATGKPNTHLIRARTGDNPFNHRDFEATLREQYGDTLFARQELAGEFVSLEGAEFDAAWFAGDDLWFDAWPTQGIRWAVQSLDPSKGTDGLGRDYQAHVTIAACIEGGRWVYYVDADLRREGVVPMCERAVNGCRAFHVATGRPIDSLVIEDNATMGLLPSQLAQACAKLQYAANWSCRASTANKNQRIMAWVGPPLSRRQLRFRRTPGARMLVGQCQSFPSAEFDDGPDALASGLKRLTELMGGGQ